MGGRGPGAVDVDETARQGRCERSSSSVRIGRQDDRK